MFLIRPSALNCSTGSSLLTKMATKAKNRTRHQHLINWSRFKIIAHKSFSTIKSTILRPCSSYKLPSTKIEEMIPESTMHNKSAYRAKTSGELFRAIMSLLFFLNIFCQSFLTRAMATEPTCNFTFELFLFLVLLVPYKHCKQYM